MGLAQQESIALLCVCVFERQKQGQKRCNKLPEKISFAIFLKSSLYFI